MFEYNVTNIYTGAVGNYVATVSSTDNSGNVERLSYTFAVTAATPPSPPTISTNLLVILAVLILTIAAAITLLRGRKSMTPRDKSP